MSPGRKPEDDNPFEDVMTGEVEVEITSPVKVTQGTQLRLIDGDGPRHFILSLDRIVIGRSSEADLTIDSREVSRLHAAIERRGEVMFLCDLDSRHGVLLNGVRVHSCQLHFGDTLQIGATSYIFERFSSEP